MVSKISSTIDELWIKALWLVMNDGDDVRPRGMRTREVRGATLVMDNSRANVLRNRTRKLNYHFQVAEWLWMHLGQSDVSSIAPFNKKIADFSDDGERFSGAYGPKLVEQLPYILKALQSDADSRQAVLSIWRERPGPTKDVPCTCVMQWFNRKNRLEMITYMRSNDLWLGFPYDVFNFTQVQAYLAMKLGLEPGPYIHKVGSLHLYEQHFDQANTAVLTQGTSFVSPDLTPVDNNLLAAAFNGVAAQALVDARLPDPWDGYIVLLANRFVKNLVPQAPLDVLVQP